MRTFVEQAFHVHEDIGEGGELLAVLEQLRQVVGDALSRGRGVVRVRRVRGVLRLAHVGCGRGGQRGRHEHSLPARAPTRERWNGNDENTDGDATSSREDH